MSNEMLLFLGTVIGSFLTFLNARSSASSGAVTALSEAVGTLREELEAEKKARKEDKNEFQTRLKLEEDYRKSMEKRFDEERAAYKAYIEVLVLDMQKANLPIPPFEG